MSPGDSSESFMALITPSPITTAFNPPLSSCFQVTLPSHSWLITPSPVIRFSLIHVKRICSPGDSFVLVRSTSSMASPLPFQFGYTLSEMAKQCQECSHTCHAGGMRRNIANGIQFIYTAHGIHLYLSSSRPTMQ